MSDDPILAAIQATKYADAIMARTAANSDEPHTDWQPKYRGSFVEKWHPPYGETHPEESFDPDDKQDPFDPRLIGAGLRRVAADFPPEGPHDDWRRAAADSEYIDWHPPVGSGETHAKYRVHPNRSDGRTTRWFVEHSGTYQGMKTVNFPPSKYRDYDSSTMPSYSRPGSQPDMLGTFDTLDDAKNAAHQHFQQTYGGGSGMGDVDLNQLSGQGDAKTPRHYDLPDFGRSEGSGFYLGIHQRLAAAAWRQRIAAELSPPCPDCGQVAGFDEHMVSPRVKACRNCGWTMTDYGVDELLKETLRGHDREVSDLPETDHPTLGKNGNRNPPTH